MSVGYILNALVDFQVLKRKANHARSMNRCIYETVLTFIVLDAGKRCNDISSKSRCLANSFASYFDENSPRRKSIILFRFMRVFKRSIYGCLKHVCVTSWVRKTWIDLRIDTEVKSYCSPHEENRRDRPYQQIDRRCSAGGGGYYGPEKYHIGRKLAIHLLRFPHFALLSTLNSWKAYRLLSAILDQLPCMMLSETLPLLFMHHG